MGARSGTELPRGLLLDTLWVVGWSALTLGCQAIVCNYAADGTQHGASGPKRRLSHASYTVNDEWAARRLIALGTDGIITDRWISSARFDGDWRTPLATLVASLYSARQAIYLRLTPAIAWPAIRDAAGP